ncbi:MAG: hypothetical protein V1693_02120 [Nanoarchaeota archaeon]
MGARRRTYVFRKENLSEIPCAKDSGTSRLSTTTWNLADGEYIVHRQYISNSGKHHCSISFLIVKDQKDKWEDYNGPIPEEVCSCLQPIPLQS